MRSANLADNAQEARAHNQPESGHPFPSLDDLDFDMDFDMDLDMLDTQPDVPSSVRSSKRKAKVKSGSEGGKRPKKRPKKRRRKTKADKRSKRGKKRSSDATEGGKPKVKSSVTKLGKKADKRIKKPEPDATATASKGPAPFALQDRQDVVIDGKPYSQMKWEPGQRSHCPVCFACLSALGAKQSLNKQEVFECPNCGSLLVYETPMSMSDCFFAEASDDAYDNFDSTVTNEHEADSEDDEEPEDNVIRKVFVSLHIVHILCMFSAHFAYTLHVLYTFCTYSACSLHAIRVTG